jgi:peptidoglycan/LPS O-acetylase OafA/YrhL
VVFGFHADLSLLTGGFIGVDVFFVISGYLITSIILRDVAAERFSLLNFWERRVRRIVPALSVVVAITLIAFSFVHFPSDFETLGWSVLAQALFLQNFVFYSQSGYFAGPAEAIPLLHTWSLAVEEQFYLLFPLLFLGVLGLRRRRITQVVAILALLSFALSVAGIATHPNATFYFLPTRAWELLLGSLIALGVLPRGPRWLCEIASAAGITAILAAAIIYTRDTTFPGSAALAPCLGTAAILWSDSSARTLVGRVLAMRPIVFVGLLSYSFYLWHWPLLSFARYTSMESLSPSDIVAILLASLAIAWASWRFVEQPVRQRRVLAMRHRLVGSAAAFAVLLATSGSVILLTNGLPARMPDSVTLLASASGERNPRRNECHSIEPERIAEGELCLLGPPQNDAMPQILSWGDSHADAAMPVLEALAERFAISAWHATYSGCVSLLDITYVRWPHHGCPDFNAAMFDFLQRNKASVKHVILMSRWSVHVEGYETGNLYALISDSETIAGDVQTARVVFRRRMADTVDRLLALGMTVWIVAEVPQQDFNVPTHSAKLALLGKEVSSIGRTYAHHVDRNRFVNEVLADLKSERVRVLYPDSILCRDTGICHAVRDGRSLYRDAHHLSTFGAMHLGPMFEPVFRAVTDDRRGR